MKRLIVYCCVYSCNTVLHTTDYDFEGAGYQEFEGVGEACESCQEQDKKPPKFEPIRFGTKQVESSESFEDMMAKRKIENRKKSGKGPPRGGGR